MEEKTKFNIQKCLELGLLRRVPRSKEKAEESLKNSKEWLKEAENNLNSGAIKSCVLTSYLAMFHVAKALLFLEGYREKSHFAVARFLEEKYVQTNCLEKEWINLLDYYREMRHEDQYSLSFFVTENEGQKAFQTAKEFVGRIEKLIKKEITRL